MIPPTMKITQKIRYETLYQLGQPEADSIGKIIGIPNSKTNIPPTRDRFHATKAIARAKGKSIIVPP